MRLLCALFICFCVPHTLYTSSWYDALWQRLPVPEKLNCAHAYMSGLFGTHFHRSYFGATYADESTQRMVHDIMRMMGFKESAHVHVMYLNEQGFATFGIENLIAMHNTIFIDKEWFDAITEDEQRFLIAHELAHIYNQDPRTMTIVVAATASLIAYKLMQCVHNQETMSGYASWLGFSVLMIPTYSRYIEQRADIQAASTLGSSKGGIACCKRWLLERPITYDAIWDRWLADFSATHPSHESRLQALEALLII